jgi:acyl-CoA thioester hydrolase
VARHEIDDRRPMRDRPGTVTVRTWVEKVAAASFTLGYEISHPEQVYAQAKSVMVTFDADGQHARRLQPAEREWLAGFTR